ALDERAEFIDREEVLHAIAELLRHIPSVVGERLPRLLGLPPSVLVLQGLRQVPMIQSGERLDARLLQLLYQAAVAVEALRVGLARALGKDARPRDRKPVRGGADVLHQRNVFLVPVVMVVGDVAVVVVLYMAWLVRIRVPDGSAFAIRLPRALDLIRRC